MCSSIMLQVKSIRKMNQHSGFPLLASSNYSRRKRKYWFNLGTDVSYNMYTNFFHTGYDVYILVHLSLTYTETTCP